MRKVSAAELLTIVNSGGRVSLPTDNADLRQLAEAVSEMAANPAQVNIDNSNIAIILGTLAESMIKIADRKPESWTFNVNRDDRGRIETVTGTSNA